MLSLLLQANNMGIRATVRKCSDAPMKTGLCPFRINRTPTISFGKMAKAWLYASSTGKKGWLCQAASPGQMDTS